MSSGWCDWLGHHFVESFWPWRPARCLHCGITEAQAFNERARRFRLEAERLKAKHEADRPRVEAVLARSRELLFDQSNPRRGAGKQTEETPSSDAY